jgi:hypothetical protein
MSDREPSPACNFTCGFCGRSAANIDGMFIAAQNASGIWIECLGVAMSIVATEDRAKFLRLVDQAHDANFDRSI